MLFLALFGEGKRCCGTCGCKRCAYRRANACVGVIAKRNPAVVKAGCYCRGVIVVVKVGSVVERNIIGLKLGQFAVAVRVAVGI